MHVTCMYMHVMFYTCMLYVHACALYVHVICTCMCMLCTVHACACYVLYMHVHVMYCTCMCMLCTVHACACYVLYMHVHVMYCTCMLYVLYVHVHSTVHVRVPHKWCRRNVPDCQHGMGSFYTVSPRLKWSGQKTCSLNQSEMVGSMNIHTYAHVHKLTVV